MTRKKPRNRGVSPVPLVLLDKSEAANFKLRCEVASDPKEAEEQSVS
jgi:hypothetical protein